MKIDEYMKSTEKPVDLCKEIDELRAENQMLKNQNNMLTCFCDDCKKIEKLQKENEELKEQLKNNPYVQILQKEKSEMAEDFAKQIEKMKCCANCKHSYSVNTGGCYDTKCELTGLDCINCKDKWELAE